MKGDDSTKYVFKSGTLKPPARTPFTWILMYLTHVQHNAHHADDEDGSDGECDVGDGGYFPWCSAGITKHLIAKVSPMPP